MKTEEITDLIRTVQSSFVCGTNIQYASANEATGRIVSTIIACKHAEALVNKAKELLDD